DPQSVLAYVQSLEDQQTIDELTYLLKYHVVQGNYTSSTLKNNQKLTTLNGTQLTVIKKNRSIQLKTNNNTFSTVVTPNIKASNGTIHIISDILFGNTSRAFPDYQVSDDLVVLFGQIKDQNLEGFLTQPKKKFTFVGPVNQAFYNLASDPNDFLVIAEELGKITNDKPLIQKILRNHIFEGEIKFKDLKNGQILTNVLGDKVQVSINGKTVKFTDVTSKISVTVIQADVKTPFGVLHKIDKVLLP
ncbi:MAG: fasciclin domain-containing protein, partial [Patescibacteria group bacterium]